MYKFVTIRNTTTRANTVLAHIYSHTCTRTEAVSSVHLLVYCYGVNAQLLCPQTVDRLPPGVVSIAVHEVDDVFDAVAVSVVMVVTMLGVTFETFV